MRTPTDKHKLSVYTSDQPPRLTWGHSPPDVARFFISLIVFFRESGSTRDTKTGCKARNSPGRQKAIPKSLLLKLPWHSHWINWNGVLQANENASESKRSSLLKPQIRRFLVSFWFQTQSWVSLHGFYRSQWKEWGEGRGRGGGGANVFSLNGCSAVHRSFKISLVWFQIMYMSGGQPWPILLKSFWIGHLL